jgi:hypothetical protein
VRARAMQNIFTVLIKKYEYLQKIGKKYLHAKKEYLQSKARNVINGKIRRAANVFAFFTHHYRNQ